MFSVSLSHTYTQTTCESHCNAQWTDIKKRKERWIAGGEMDGGMRKRERYTICQCVVNQVRLEVCEIIKHTQRHGTAVRHITHTTQITHTHPPAVYKRTHTQEKLGVNNSKSTEPQQKNSSHILEDI